MRPINLNIYSQNSLSQLIVDQELKPLENVLCINTTNQSYSYSNIKGDVNLSYNDQRDSIKFQLPGYKEKILNIKNVKESQYIKLEAKVHILDEVLLISNSLPKNYDHHKIIKSRKKYSTKITGHNTSIMSSYKHNKCDGCILDSVILKFIPDDLSVMIRPLIYSNKNGKLMRVLESPQTIVLYPHQENLIINLKDFNIKFIDNETYYIGFEIVNNSQKINTLEFKVSSSKKTHSLIKTKPSSDWFKIKNGSQGYTLDHELFFKKTE